MMNEAMGIVADGIASLLMSTLLCKMVQKMYKEFAETKSSLAKKVDAEGVFPQGVFRREDGC